MQTPQFQLNGKAAVVTGAGQGIGFAIAQAMAGMGARVVVAEINPTMGENAAAQLRAQGFDAQFMALDVRKPDQVRQVAMQSQSLLGRVDILVNNAGIVTNTPAENTADDEWLTILDVNLNGVFWCCREFGRLMLAQGTGAIVNIASMSGIISNHPQPQAAYNTSKAAVIMLTKSLAGEWASRGVRVNAIAPGYIATELTKRGMSNEAWRTVWLNETPMHRPGEPSEVASAAVYLASDAASYVTGSVFSVDGGYTVW
jgi:NAD(P)-dependent dehydrogenase (short-subunit alcohol dehydrogenase family)